MVDAMPRRTTLITIGLLAFLIVATLFARWIAGQLAIDSCLDSGGRWNYEQRFCERS